jgi:hypothetical protein
MYNSVNFLDNSTKANGRLLSLTVEVLPLLDKLVLEPLKFSETSPEEASAR